MPEIGLTNFTLPQQRLLSNRVLGVFSRHCKKFSVKAIKLNNGYKSRFGFPFILAVKGHDKHSIMKAFQARLENDPEQEQIEALKQIAEIGRFRLESLVKHEA